MRRAKTRAALEKVLRCIYMFRTMRKKVTGGSREMHDEMYPMQNIRRLSN
jgi:hypothetical protein